MLLSRWRGKQGVNVVPWLGLTAAGLVLCLATVIVFVFTDVHEPGAEYIPPRVIDGEIQPGQFKDRE